MSVKEMKNVAASVLARLRNISKSSGAPFQQVLQQYAIERFLYRISKSTHAQSVVLKGALLLKTVGIQGARPTMDIDLLRKGKADQASLVALVKDCATLEVEADGLIYIADSADDQLPAFSSWNAMLMGESMAAQYPGAAWPPTSKRHKADFRLL
jgi:hypothetical protein